MHITDADYSSNSYLRSLGCKIVNSKSVRYGTHLQNKFECEQRLSEVKEPQRASNAGSIWIEERKRIFPYHAKVKSVVQDNAQEGIVDVDFAVVPDEAQLPEFVHEKIDPRPRRADHLREHLLRYFGKHLLRLARCAIVR